MTDRKYEGRGSAPMTFKNGQPVSKRSFNSGDRDGDTYERRKADKKPYGKKDGDGEKRYDGGHGKPYGKPGEGGERRYDGGQRKPYGKPGEGGGERRYDGGQRKPYGKPGEGGGERRYDGGQRKPYGKPDEGGGERRYDGGQRKPYGKPGEGGERRYDGGQRKPYGKPGGDGEKRYDGGQRKPYGKSDGDTDRKYDARRRIEDAPDKAQQAVQEDELPYIVMGRNAVKEAVKSGRSIDRILVNREQDGSLREIIGLARDRNIQIRETDKAKLDELCMPFGHGGRTGNHQGIVAQVPGVEYCEISDILAAAAERGEKPFVIILDGIEDPHNLGSIIRSAECAGAHGVIIPKRRSAGVTASACKASAGAVEYVKVARVSNLSGAIDRLKDEGLWIAGADMSGTPMAEAKLEGAIALVVGGEGNGISELVKKNCDFLVSIPMYGRINSLNAAMAAAVLMFEKKRRDF